MNTYWKWSSQLKLIFFFLQVVEEEEEDFLNPIKGKWWFTWTYTNRVSWQDLTGALSSHPSIHPFWHQHQSRGAGGGARWLFCFESVVFLLGIAETSFNLQRLRPVGNRLERSAPEVSTLFWVVPTEFTVVKPRLCSNPALWTCAFVWNKEINQIKWLILIGSIPSSKQRMIKYWFLLNNKCLPFKKKKLPRGASLNAPPITPMLRRVTRWRTGWNVRLEFWNHRSLFLLAEHISSHQSPSFSVLSLSLPGSRLSFALKQSKPQTNIRTSTGAHAHSHNSTLKSGFPIAPAHTK